MKLYTQTKRNENLIKMQENRLVSKKCTNYSIVTAMTTTTMASILHKESRQSTRATAKIFFIFSTMNESSGPTFDDKVSNRGSLMRRQAVGQCSQQRRLGAAAVASHRVKFINFDG